LNGYPDYILMVLVFSISILALIPAWINYDIISTDGVYFYIPVVKLFLKGNFHEALYGKLEPLFPLPLYEFLIFITVKITGFSLETSSRLVASSAYVIGSVGIYKFTKEIANNRATALISVLLYLSHRKLLEYSVDCLKESLLICLILWANFLIIKGINSTDRKKPIYFVSGIFLFLSGAMVRGTSLIFLAAWLIIWIFHKKDNFLIRSLVLIVPVSIAVILIVTMPDLPLFRNSLNIPHYLGGFGASYSNTTDFMNSVTNLMSDFMAKTYYLVGFFGIIGIYFYRNTPYAKHLAVTLLIFLEVFLGRGWNDTGRESIRYIIAPIIYLLPIASCAVVSSIGSSSRFLKYLAILTIVSAPFLWAGKAFTPPDTDRLARKEAGVWILSKCGAEKDIITNQRRIAFYAEGYPAIIDVYPDLNKMDKAIAWGRETRNVKLKDVLSHKSLKKVVAVDYQSDDFAKSWVNMLDELGIKPDKKFRSIYVYLPPPDID
jgi:hypothetical protein